MIIGHSKQWERLKDTILKNNIPHAVLFSGEEGIGKKKVALRFASLLLFNDDSDIAVEKLLKGLSPDFYFLEPEGERIKIDEVRAINKKISLSSEGFKIVIVDKAHLMNPEAQNCFLKTLEEPKGRTVIIMITEHPERLLPTINSRVQQLKFYAPTKKEIISFLKSKELKEEEIDKIYFSAFGKPGLVINFLESLDSLKKREDEMERFMNIVFKNENFAVRFKYAEELSKRDDLTEVFNLWLSFFHYLLLSKEGILGKNIILEKYIEGISLERINNIAKEIQNTYFLISSTNVNLRLALEILLIKI
jgi:DNA polymerase-3 subunit delta'